MVLFLCIFSGVLALIVCLLWRVKIHFCAELNDTHLYARAKLCLLFGLVKIPMDIDTNIIALLRKKQKKTEKEKPKRKQLLHKLLWNSRKTGTLRLAELNCKGIIGDAGDAFCSVMAAGAVQTALELLLRVCFPSHQGRIAIAPVFDRHAIWIYMEGILEILPTQIIGVLIRVRKQGGT